MKIVLNKNGPKKVCINDVKGGEVFEYAGEFYIKTNRVMTVRSINGTSDIQANSIRLINGQPTLFSEGGEHVILRTDLILTNE